MLHEKQLGGERRVHSVFGSGGSFFFFSSRRRHTRLQGDWSSDVCSSDLTANAVGEKMRQIARNRQVLCITHLPQVAAPASAHYVANKHTRAGRTISEIKIGRASWRERV